MNAAVNPATASEHATATAAPVNMLSERAMLVKLNITSWTARRLDKAVTRKVNRDHNAADDAGRYNKMLISPESLEPISKIDNEARDYLYSVTSPWLDDGARILSSALATQAFEKFREIRQRREAAVSRFVAAYPDLVMDARVRLNGMFNAADYPAASDIESRFRFRVTIDPVPDSDDFRVNLGEEQAADIKRQIEERAREAAERVTRDCFERVAEHVGRMAERLRAYQPGTEGKRAQGTFRDSLVENIRELSGLLPGLNIMGDPRLTAVSDRLSDLTKHDADTLRENELARSKTAARAESILADVNDYLA